MKVLNVLLIGLVSFSVANVASAQVTQPAQTAPASQSATIALVWGMVNENYIDRNFNGKNWQSIRQQFVKPYASLEAAERATQAMLEQLQDPQTHFVTADEYRRLSEDAAKIGIGLQFMHASDRTLQVVAPIDGSPAAIVGLLPHDRIQKIDAKSTEGLSIYDVAHLIQGSPNSTVQLTIQRDNKTQTFTVKREPFTIEPVKYQSIALGQQSIGYIRVAQLSNKATIALKTAIQTLEQKGVSGYILDLRSNPGGSLSASVDAAKLWLDSGTIASIQQRTETQKATAAGTALTQKPLVVLVDRGTASTSEILAAALQENRRAIVVGSPTFGNNHIQELIPLADGSAVSITSAKWLTPSGNDIYTKGLKPTVQVDLTPNQQAIWMGQRAIATAADVQYTKAINVLRQEMMDRK